MAKSDRNLDEVNLYPAYQDQYSATFVDGKLINAFDTETSSGTVFMLTSAYGDKTQAYYNRDVSELDAETIMDALTDYKTRSNINIWYNLDFDANAILSGILSQKEMSELVVTNETTTTVAGIEYEIFYIKGKMLRIVDENGNISPHYDIAQFFYTSLDNAAEEWLGENKKEGIDTSKFDDKEYIKDNFDEILKYAKKDASLTQDLAIELTNEAENLDIPMGRPISTGYLSAEYLRANTEEKPSLGNEAMQNLFWESYYGGRFEVFQRGNVGEVVAPDINSAYPAIMKDLPDPTTLNWNHYLNEVSDKEPFSHSINKFGYEEIENGHYGVVKARVTTDSSRMIQPFACKIDGKVKFPAMTNKVVTVIKPIFEFAVNNGLVTDFELIEAWIGNITDRTSKPFEFIGDMYAERKVFEQLKNKPKKGQLLKIVLNSSYGKTCQTTEKRHKHDLDKDGKKIMQAHETQYPRFYLSKKQREALGDDEIIITELEAGKRFNPFFASYITGLTRLELHKQVVEHDIEDSTVMFATDCLMVEKEAYENSSFDEQIHVPDDSLPESEFRKEATRSLGAWDFDYEGSAFIVGSGVYEVDTIQGKTKTKTRGFIESNLGDTLKGLAKKHKEAIPLDNERPLTMAEVLINTERGSVSEFVENSKKLKPDFDDKRNWNRENPNFHDLLNDKEYSKPIDLQEQKEEMIQEQMDINEKMIGDATPNGNETVVVKDD
ncbi:putative DNA polymerase type B [His2 virus]|uniref:Putative DNA polymerase type B n=1 Tax=His 2 virus TaxID=128710 RepID=Q25BE6_HIS2V|nr:DNA polymerase [His2 virus]AAQ13776.1 putative DNA polymerase type B [His2 virus]